MKVGFIGLGAMGAPMAERIAQAGHELHVWARRPASLPSELLALSAEVHASPASLAAAVDYVGICVTSADDIRQVLVGSGALTELRRGAVVAVHSTISPDEAISLAGLVRQSGGHFLDAPVSGARQGARRGELLVLVGGEESVLQMCMPVVETYSATVEWVGPVGAGQRAKILNNLVMNANIAVAQLVLELAPDAGIPREQLRRAMLRGSGASRGMEALDVSVLPGKWSPVNGYKDLGLAADLLQRVGHSNSPLHDAIDMAVRVRHDMAPPGSPSPPTD